MCLDYKGGQNHRLFVQLIPEDVAGDKHSQISPYLNPRGAVETRQKIDKRLGQGLAMLYDSDKPSIPRMSKSASTSFPGEYGRSSLAVTLETPSQISYIPSWLISRTQFLYPSHSRILNIFCKMIPRLKWRVGCSLGLNYSSMV